MPGCRPAWAHRKVVGDFAPLRRDHVLGELRRTVNFTRDPCTHPALNGMAYLPSALLGLAMTAMLGSFSGHFA